MTLPAASPPVLSIMSTTPRSDLKSDVISPAPEVPPPRTRSPPPCTPADNFALTPTAAVPHLVNPSAEPAEAAADDEADTRLPPPTQPAIPPRRTDVRPSSLAVVLSPCRAPAVGPSGTRNAPEQRRSALAAAGTRRVEPSPMNAVAVRPAGVGAGVAAAAAPAAATAAATVPAATATAAAVPLPDEVAVADASPPVVAAAAAPSGLVPEADTEEDDIHPVRRAPAAVVPAAGSTRPGPSSPSERALDPTQGDRRDEILKINADEALSDAEKSAMISSVLQTSAGPILSTIRNNMRKRLKSSMISYHNEKAGVLGCEHYPRRCCVKPACCDGWHVCRLCHNECEDHECDRKKIEAVKCMLCNEEQPVAAHCRSCNILFARYFCEICRLYDDTPNKHLYHCDKCGICRVGENNYHCDTCNACVSPGKDNKKHRCVKGALDACCPCCQGYLYDSVSKVVFTLCGHAMHHECLERYVTTSYVCPLCHKELGDMNHLYGIYDREIEAQPMPPEYAHHRVVIKCYQCSASSDVQFHLTYRHRCGVGTCRSYNTYIERQYVADPHVAGSSSMAPASVPVAGPPSGGGDGPGAGGDAAQP